MTEDWGCICCHFPIIKGMEYMTYIREGKKGYMCKGCFERLLESSKKALDGTGEVKK